MKVETEIKGTTKYQTIIDDDDKITNIRITNIGGCCYIPTEEKIMKSKPVSKKEFSKYKTQDKKDDMKMIKSAMKKKKK